LPEPSLLASIVDAADRYVMVFFVGSLAMSVPRPRIESPRRRAFALVAAGVLA
jgi:hypothetical protein